MSIEITLSNIIKKYNLENKNIADYIYREIADVLYEYANYNSVAVVCGGRHTVHLLEDFGYIFKNKVKIIDKYPEAVKNNSLFNHFDIFGYNEIHNVDVLIISTFQYREEVKELISKSSVKHIVDLYSILNEKNIVLSMEYYALKNIAYVDVICFTNLYKKTSDKKIKEDVVRCLIATFLTRKDIYSAKLWIKEYIQEKFLYYREYVELLEEVQNLENDIKIQLENRTQKDIIWFWIDGLRYDLSCQMPFLNICRKNGVSFENAYNIALSTRNTYGGIFERKDEISLFTKPRKENQILKLMRSEGYDCYRICGGVSKNSCLVNLENFEYKSNTLGDSKYSCTEYYWELIKLLLSSKKPVFAILHTMIETHPPYISPAIEYYDECLTKIDSKINMNRLEEFESMALKSALYIDNVNEYFFSMFPQNSTKIYMSDHGDIMSKNSRQHTEDTSHIPFIVLDNKIPCICEKRLFHLKNFYEMLKYILYPSKDSYENMISDYICLTGIDMYNDAEIDNYIHIGIPECIMSYRGIRTLKDKYVYNAAGNEIYNILPDEVNNLIESPEYEERINELRELSGNEFIDISKSEKFKYSIKLYHAIGKERLF